ncbi:hypothetical protein BD410DRAFT_796684 [Rickenella mellea]|uniref:Uncharacterized protein n=1 Tax=Rickenella mellea TaxID=50990 RepID=A0A4Y7PJT0_9AGAM|nr:hypothetical protein BD410DRAFT_796684 [Rickenella mellea]
MDTQVLSAIARRTLGREKSDIRPISAVYYAHLKQFLARHPGEDNFTIKLDDGVGRVYCLTCEMPLAAGNGTPEENGVDIFGSLNNYEKHLLSPSHLQNRGADVKMEQEDESSSAPTPGTSSYYDSPAPTHPQSPVYWGSNGSEVDYNSPVKYEPDEYFATHLVTDNTFAGATKPSSEVIDVDADYQLALQIDREINELFRQGETHAVDPPHRLNDNAATPASESAYEWKDNLPYIFVPGPEQSSSGSNSDYSSTGAALSPASVQSPGYDYWSAASPSVSEPGPSNFESADAVPRPLEEMYQSQLQDMLERHPLDQDSCTLYKEGQNVIQARCTTCHYSVGLPASGSFELFFDEVLTLFSEYENHLGTPIHVRKRLERQASTPAQSITIPQAIAPNALKRKFPGSWPDDASANGNQFANPYADDTFGGGQQQPVASGSGYAQLKQEPTYNHPYSSLQNALGQRSHSGAERFGSAHPQIRAPPPQLQLQRQAQALQMQQGGIIQRTANTVFGGIGAAYGAVQPVVQQAVKSFQENYAANWAGYGYYSGSNGGDFGLNYDEMGPVSRIDRTGPDAEKRFKDFLSKAMDEFKDVISVNEAQAKLKLKSQDDILPGMRVRLLPHQIIGVSWMLEQERDDEKLGGILADAMGIGKTVQMLATMVMNAPAKVKEQEEDDDEILIFDGESHRRFIEGNSAGKKKGKDKEERRTTLVLAPASLLQQWFEEVTDKCDPTAFRAHIHHGKDKLKTVDEVGKYDVVITTYQTLNMDFPKLKKDNKGQEIDGAVEEADEGSDDEDPDTRKRQWGVLAKVKWYRVVIDEAQNIRNRSTRISINCAKLNSMYRWCLTGTPITNTLADIYGFLRFCHFEPWNDWQVFNKQVAKLQKKDPAKAGRKAQTILKRHLLRRTKDTKLDGKPILQLGPKTIDMIELDFTPEEREIYKGIEEKQKQKISKFIKAGTVMKNYAFILVMILRLRQLCCHPNLILTKAQNNGEEEEDTDGGLSEYERAVKELGPETLKSILERFRRRAENRLKAERGSIEMDDEECSICFEPLVNNGRITPCGHEFCYDCINELLRVLEGAEAGEDGPQCPMCRSAIDRKRIYKSSAFEPSEAELEQIARSIPAEDRPQKRVKLEENFVDLTLEDDDFARQKNASPTASTSALVKAEPEVPDDILTKLRGEEYDWEPSTKMLKMRETLLQWLNENPADKAIIYSQWTSMLDLVGVFLKQQGIETIRYDGKMNRMARVEAIQRFKKPNGPRVMMISLKCGGVGLNLTVANRVINLDLAWNYATEAQAYDRVHRLGQHKPVSIQRLIIRDTIEERIIRLQGRKQGLSDAALGEGTAGKIKRMTAKEIAELFDL